METSASALSDAPAAALADTRSTPSMRWGADSAWARLALARSAGAMLVLTLLKGLITRPHEWAIAHYLLNYSHGFVRRALVGTLLMPLFIGKRGVSIRELIVGFAFVQITLFGVFAVRALRELTARPQGGPRYDDVTVACLFASSAFVWNTSIGLGYFDALIAVLALIALRHGKLALGTATPIIIVAMLVHEVAAFICAPLLALAALSAAPERPGIDTRRAAQVALAVLGLGALALFIFKAGPSEALKQQMSSTGAATDEWVNNLYLLMNETFNGQVEAIFELKTLGRIYWLESIALLPTPLLMAALGVMRIWHAPLAPRARVVWCGLYLVVSFSVLSVCLVAYDFVRMYALSALQAFLAYSVVRHKLGNDVGESAGSRWVAVVGLGVVILNLLTPGTFTFMEPRSRFQPLGYDTWLSDPLRMRELSRILPR
ncbi:MAG: hypothetical protein ABW321_34275 [Polyangiales bacterium]